MDAREFARREADGNNIVLWAIAHCDEVVVDWCCEEYDWIVFRFGTEQYAWNPDDGWDGDVEEIAQRVIADLEAQCDALRAQVLELTAERDYLDAKQYE